MIIPYYMSDANSFLLLCCNFLRFEALIRAMKPLPEDNFINTAFLNNQNKHPLTPGSLSGRSEKEFLITLYNSYNTLWPCAAYLEIPSCNNYREREKMQWRWTRTRYPFKDKGGKIMSDYCVVVTGGARARFFTLEPVEFPELESGPRLCTCGELLNPEKEMRERELYSDSKTGRGRAPHGGPAHGYDDRRSRREDNVDRRFAREILKEVRRLAAAKHARNIVLVAGNPMLGCLRQELDIILKHGVTVNNVAKDMTKFSPARIHEHLARQNMIPAKRKPGI